MVSRQTQLATWVLLGGCCDIPGGCYDIPGGCYGAAMIIQLVAMVLLHSPCESVNPTV